MLRTALFLLPLLALLAAFEAALRSIPNNYSYIDDQLLNNGDRVELLILGNSHAYTGVNPDGFHLDGFSAANVSQDHRFDRALLERYIHRLPNLKTLIIPVSYASIGARVELGSEPWRMRNYAIYLGQGCETLKAEDHFEVLAAGKGALIQSLWAYWTHDEDKRSCETHGGTVGKALQQGDFSELAAQAAKRHTKGADGPYGRNESDLSRLMAVAEEQGIRVLLFAPPAHEAYRMLLDEEQLNLSRSVPQRLVTEHSGATYLDLFDDARFEAADFGDPDHVNAAGNAKLTAILADAVRSMCGEPNRE